MSHYKPIYRKVVKPTSQTATQNRESSIKPITPPTHLLQNARIIQVAVPKQNLSPQIIGKGINSDQLTIPSNISKVTAPVETANKLLPELVNSCKKASDRVVASAGDVYYDGVITFTTRSALLDNTIIINEQGPIPIFTLMQVLGLDLNLLGVKSMENTAAGKCEEMFKLWHNLVARMRDAISKTTAPSSTKQEPSTETSKPTSENSNIQPSNEPIAAVPDKAKSAPASSRSTNTVTYPPVTELSIDLLSTIPKLTLVNKIESIPRFRKEVTTPVNDVVLKIFPKNPDFQPGMPRVTSAMVAGYQHNVNLATSVRETSPVKRRLDTDFQSDTTWTPLAPPAAQVPPVPLALMTGMKPRATFAMSIKDQLNMELQNRTEPAISTEFQNDIDLILFKVPKPGTYLPPHPSRSSVIHQPVRSCATVSSTPRVSPPIIHVLSESPSSESLSDLSSSNGSEGMSEDGVEISTPTKRDVKPFTFTTPKLLPLDKETLDRFKAAAARGEKAPSPARRSPERKTPERTSPSKEVLIRSQWGPQPSKVVPRRDEHHPNVILPNLEPSPNSLLPQSISIVPTKSDLVFSSELPPDPISPLALNYAPIIQVSVATQIATYSNSTGSKRPETSPMVKDLKLSKVSTEVVPSRQAKSCDLNSDEKKLSDIPDLIDLTTGETDSTPNQPRSLLASTVLSSSRSTGSRICIPTCDVGCSATRDGKIPTESDIKQYEATIAALPPKASVFRTIRRDPNGTFYLAPGEKLTSNNIDIIVTVYLAERGIEGMEGRPLQVYANRLIRETPDFLSRKTPKLVAEIVRILVEFSDNGMFRISSDNTRFGIEVPRSLDKLPPVPKEDLDAIWGSMSKQLINITKFTSCVNAILNTYPKWRSKTPASEQLATAAVVAFVRMKRL